MHKIHVDTKKWKEKYPSSYNKTILLFITDLCNLRCDYCFNKGNLKNCKTSTLGMMDLNYIEKIVEANPEVEKYDVMGGEPLFHPELDKIIKFLIRKQKKIGLYTNGFLIEKHLSDGYKNFRVNIAFQSIINNNKSYKPIADFAEGIKKFQFIYPIKLVLLLNNENKTKLFEIVNYIEKEFQGIKKLTIGAVRNEADYWNDEYEYVVPFKEYAQIIQTFIDNYNGRLDIDIFTKGYLYTDLMPKHLPNQLGRFKNLFPRNKYVASLYDIAKLKMLDFNPDKPIDFSDTGYSNVDGREWTDKIRLTRK